MTSDSWRRKHLILQWKKFVTDLLSEWKCRCDTGRLLPWQLLASWCRVRMSTALYPCTRTEAVVSTLVSCTFSCMTTWNSQIAKHSWCQTCVECVRKRLIVCQWPHGNVQWQVSERFMIQEAYKVFTFYAFPTLQVRIHLSAALIDRMLFDGVLVDSVDGLDVWCLLASCAIDSFHCACLWSGNHWSLIPSGLTHLPPPVVR